jgi:hypothetical protein
VKFAGAVCGVHTVFGGGTVATLRAALTEAYKHKVLSVVRVPVYDGPDPQGGMGLWL